MNEISQYKQIIEDYNKGLIHNSDLLWTLIFFVAANIILGIVSFITQIKLKNKEKGIYSHNLKEVKRIEILEKIFDTINSLSLFDRDSSISIFNEVRSLEKYVNDNILYIDKEYEKIIQGISDYYKDVSVDYRKKNYSIEMKFVEQFKKAFCK